MVSTAMSASVTGESPAFDQDFTPARNIATATAPAATTASAIWRAAMAGSASGSGSEAPSPAGNVCE